MTHPSWLVYSATSPVSPKHDISQHIQNELGVTVIYWGGGYSIKYQVHVFLIF